MEDIYIIYLSIMAIINYILTLKLNNTINGQSSKIHALEEDFDELQREFREFRIASNV
jgi:cell division protein FtsL